MIRRFLTRILMVLLLAACGYNAWQVSLLRGEVARLRSERAAGIRAPVSGGDSTWLDRANAHADRARQALARGDFGTAQQELARGGEDLRRAAATPEEKTRTTLAAARRTLASLQSQADALGRRARAAVP